MLIEVAIVSMNGIIVNKVRYSCSYAIRFKWFEKAALYGSWECFILYEQGNHSVIWILNENKTKLLRANLLINYPITQAKKRAYFKKLIYLKSLRNSRSIRNI
jgi:hypothetical protein